ncbi:RHS repeat-associated core domain-containing protein, partial [Roseofilum sp. Belize Diploria]|uniref:RHS repeat domain-containing protein n=1 Tax=Roseofilum sp. Belize Diploria TaxID=2821501 RepID=UPI001B1263F6
PYAQVLEEYDALGNLQAAYTYGEDLISRVEGGETSFYHIDGLGSTRLLTDAFGGVSESYNYDAYGNLIAGDGSDNPYLFAGEQRDVETGLDYLRARYYDPTLGRFISRDAYQGSLDDPMSQHKYQYAHANPVVNTDPSGYITLGEQLSALSVQSVLASMSYVGGYGLGAGIREGSGSVTLAIYDQYLAGFADGASGGLSTQYRARQAQQNGGRINNHQGLFFSLGRMTGIVAILGLGWGAPEALIGANISWAGRVAQLHSALSTGIGAYQSTRKILEGRATIWDWLIFLPLLTYFGSMAFRTISGRGGSPSSGSGSSGSADEVNNFVDVHEVDLEGEAVRLHDLFDGRERNRTIAVARVLDADGNPHIAVASSGGGQVVPKVQDAIAQAGYEKIKRVGADFHAEARIFKWARDNGYIVEAFAVSHQKGICISCAFDAISMGLPIDHSQVAWGWTPKPYKGLPPQMPPAPPLDLLNQSHGWIGGIPPWFYPYRK